jgi:ACS family allantoate permease-like MFS transporter
MDSTSEHSNAEKPAHVAQRLTKEQIDTAAELTAGTDIHIDPAEAARLRRKIDLHLMPLMCILYLYDIILFVTILLHTEGTQNSVCG